MRSRIVCRLTRSIGAVAILLLLPAASAPTPTAEPVKAQTVQTVPAHAAVAMTQTGRPKRSGYMVLSGLTK